MGKNTRADKASREISLTQFLAEIKENGQWTKWLSPKGTTLFVTAVCREMARRENTDAAWEASFFRGTGWGVPHKEAFNKWVYEQLHLEQTHVQLGESLQFYDLPPWLNHRDLPTEVQRFIYQQADEIKCLNKKETLLDRRLLVREEEILELNARIDSLIRAFKERDKHYMFSIRSLSYD